MSSDAKSRHPAGLGFVSMGAIYASVAGGYFVYANQTENYGYLVAMLFAFLFGIWARKGVAG